MKLEEIAHKLQTNPDIDPGTEFISSIMGHLVIITVIKNAAGRLKSGEPEANPAEPIKIEEPYQIVEEPLDVRKDQNAGSDMPAV